MPSHSEIVQLINEMGIKVNSKLKQEIASHEPHKVKLSIEAFQQYRSKTDVDNLGGCLLSMIRDEAEPNVTEKSTPKQLNQPLVVMTNNEPKKLISLDKLKQICNLFSKKK